MSWPGSCVHHVEDEDGFNSKLSWCFNTTTTIRMFGRPNSRSSKVRSRTSEPNRKLNRTSNNWNNLSNKEQPTNSRSQRWYELNRKSIRTAELSNNKHFRTAAYCVVGDPFRNSAHEPPWRTTPLLAESWSDLWFMRCKRVAENEQARPTKIKCLNSALHFLTILTAILYAFCLSLPLGYVGGE